MPTVAHRPTQRGAAANQTPRSDAWAELPVSALDLQPRVEQLPPAHLLTRTGRHRGPVGAEVGGDPLREGAGLLLRSEAAFASLLIVLALRLVPTHPPTSGRPAGTTRCRPPRRQAALLDRSQRIQCGRQVEHTVIAVLLERSCHGHGALDILCIGVANRTGTCHVIHGGAVAPRRSPPNTTQPPRRPRRRCSSSPP